MNEDVKELIETYSKHNLLQQSVLDDVRNFDTSIGTAMNGE